MASLARSGGKSTLCLANLHLLGRAWLAYQEDNHGKLVNGMVPRDAQYANSAFWKTISTFNGPYKDNAWWVNPPHKSDGTYSGDPVPCTLADEENGIRSGKLYPYVGTSAAFHCPSDLSYLRVASRGGKRSYAITAVMHGEVPNSPDCADLYSQIVRPSAKLVFLENNDTRGWAMGSWMMYCQWNPSSFSWIDTITAWHDYRTTLGFADGHAELHFWLENNTRDMIDGQWFGGSAQGRDITYMASIYLPKR
jgi:hypothetical protein